jgi:hypothetical protein
MGEPAREWYLLHAVRYILVAIVLGLLVMAKGGGHLHYYALG